MARTLWPEPARIISPGRFSRSPAGATDYLVVPQLDRPVLLLPRRPWAATAGALRNYKTSAGTTARVKLRVLSCAARLGLGELLPHRIRIVYPPGSGDLGVNSYLETALARRFLMSPFIGPPRAVQKPVLQLITSTGVTFAFTKVGVDDTTRALVRAEAATLDLLATIGWSVLSVPKVLHHGQWNGNEILVQSALASAHPRAPDSSLVSRAMVELSQAASTGRSPLAASPYWNNLHRRVSTLPASSYARLLSETLHQLEGPARGAVIGFGYWHGDWAPWNMSVSSNRVLLWDWEHFGRGVPSGYDAVHYHVQRAVVGRSVPVFEAFDAARASASVFLAPFEVPREHAALVVLLYAIEISTRYLHDGEDRMGTRMGAVQNWLEPVLSGHTQLITRATKRLTTS